MIQPSIALNIVLKSLGFVVYKLFTKVILTHYAYLTRLFIVYVMDMEN